MRGRLYILTGPSGVGKTTIARSLLSREPSLRRVITYTTRAPRGEEQDGREYHFISKETFEAMATRGEFLEWAEVYGNKYGERREDVDAFLDAGLGVLLVIDPQGAKAIMESGEPATSIFLDAETTEELVERIRRRGTESEETLARRAQDIAFDRSHASACTYRVINKEWELEQTISEIQEILHKT